VNPGGVRAGSVVGGAVLGLLAGAAMWVIGASAWFAALLGAAVLGTVVVWRSLPQLEEPIWPKHETVRGLGARDDVLVLGWAAAGRRGRVQSRAVQKARAIAAERLARRGLDLDEASDRDPVVALIGAQAYGVLHSTVSSMPSQGALLSCLDALERLDERGRP